MSLIENKIPFSALYRRRLAKVISLAPIKKQLVELLRMPLPNFIIAGAPKSGTTALWKYLSTHPEVCLPVKEPRFFSSAVGQFSNKEIGSGQLMPGTYDNGLKWYANLFSDCDSSCVIGEASTVYFSDPDSARLIKKIVPDVRLIFILRDPVSRAYSHYWQEIKLGIKLPSFDEIIHQNHPRLDYYLYISHYQARLQNFYDHFPTEQIMIATNLELKKNPIHLLQKVYKFIGVSNTYVPPTIGQTFNQQSKPIFPSLERTLRKISVSRSMQLLPDNTRKLFGRIKRNLSKLNYVSNEYPEISEFALAKLSNLLAEDIIYFKSLNNLSLK